MNKKEFLEIIKSNIEQFEYHITIVTGNSPLPKYLYTIGISEHLDFELAFAGGVIFKNEELKVIVKTIFKELQNTTLDLSKSITVKELGDFSISKVDESWSHLMFDGIFDYYKNKEIKVYQIIPDVTRKTLEIPDMSRKFIVDQQPVWQWLEKDWNYPVDQNAIAFTDIDALFGKPILEVMRWEDLEWEMFSSDGTEIPTSRKRAVTLATMIGLDKSLEKTVYLPIEKGFWRKDENSEWNDWS